MTIRKKIKDIRELINVVKGNIRNSNYVLFNFFRYVLSTKLGGEKKIRYVKVITKNNIQLEVPQNLLYILFNLFRSGWYINNDNNYIQLCNSRRSICIMLSGDIPTDILMLYEIFVEKDYGERFHGTVIDVGAYTGNSSIYFAIQGAERVIALEPNPKSFEIAKENIKTNNLENKVILLPYALAKEDGEAEFRISTERPAASSLSFKPLEVIENIIGKKHYEQVIKVKTISINSLIDQFSIPTISLLKLDCEGCEYEIIPNISEEIYSRIENIVLEFHDGLRNLPEILEKNGFSVRVTKILFPPSPSTLKDVKLGLLYASRR